MFRWSALFFCRSTFLKPFFGNSRSDFHMALPSIAVSFLLLTFYFYFFKAFVKTVVELFGHCFLYSSGSHSLITNYCVNIHMMK